MRLLLVEDDHAYQLAMAAHLRRLGGVESVHTAGDGEEGISLLVKQAIDLVLLDLGLPGIGGLATCRQITSSSEIPVLILTSHDDPHWVQRIWQAGARGYLHKELGFENVEVALNSLIAGASWWDHKATVTLQSSSGFRHARNPEHVKRIDSLTSRERDVLAYIAKGDDNRTIAKYLGIGEGTVRGHVHVLLQKLQVSNRTQAALVWLGQIRDRSDAKEAHDG